MLPIRARKPRFTVHQQNGQGRRYFDSKVAAVIHGQFVLHPVPQRALLRWEVRLDDYGKQMRSRLIETMMKGQRHLAGGQGRFARDGDSVLELPAIDFQANSMRRGVGVLTE